MTADASTKRDRIAQFLQEKTSQGKRFFKSKNIADATGLSSREVGSNLLVLQDSHPTLSIEQHANSRSTTWRITSETTQERDAPLVSAD